MDLLKVLHRIQSCLDGMLFASARYSSIPQISIAPPFIGWSDCKIRVQKELHVVVLLNFHIMDVIYIKYIYIYV